jgi:hypothetical protein
MNPDYILNNVPDKDSRNFSYRSMAVNKEAYSELKSLNYHKKWDKIYKPEDLNKPLKKVYHGSLPYDHGMYNEGFPHLNTYSTHNYIPVTHPVHKMFPSVGAMSSVMKNREKIINQ